MRQLKQAIISLNKDDPNLGQDGAGELQTSGEEPPKTETEVLAK